MKRKAKPKNRRPKKNDYKELAHRYKLLSDLMDQIPDVIYFKNKNGRLLMVNQAHARGLGLKPEQVVGKTDFDFFPKKRAELMARDDVRVMKTGKAIIDKVERATRPDGVDNYSSTTKIPRYDDKGKIAGLIGITRDITHRTQVEHLQEEKARIQKKLDALEELSSMKSEFVSVVSHELRTPLAIIKEAVMLILEEFAGPVSDKQKELLSKAKDNIERLKGIIEDLLDISRIERGTLKLHYSLVNLNELLLDSSEYFGKIAHEKGLGLKYILPEDQVNIFIDAARINQVVSNLITNAIKFTGQNGSIKIGVEILETKVRIGVIDTGIGISKDNLSSLFDKFVQFSKSQGAQRKGLGLGLSIAKELVKKHGGEIWTESKPGVGSRFYFTLPRFYTAKALDSEVRNSVNSLLNKGISVYLVDILIVNFKEFKKKIKGHPKKLFYALKEIIDEVIKESYGRGKKKAKVVIEDYGVGEWSILFSETTEKEIARVCKLFVDSIKRYFKENRIENVFINLGALPYSRERESFKSEQLFANIYLKKISIGSEIRRFRRISCKVTIDIILSKDRKESSQTVDISEGGLCFVTDQKLETDGKVSIKLALPRKKEPLAIKARVAWIRDIKEETGVSFKKYTAGLEFIEIKERERKRLSRLIKSISS